MNFEQFCYKVPLSDGREYTSDIFNDSQVSKNILLRQAKQIGIQAPPGTKFLINNFPIVIGPSGTYEFADDNLTIDSLEISSQSSYNIIIDVAYKEE